MNNLWERIKAPKIKAIDIGAADSGDRHTLQNLFDQNAVDLIGFEPNEEECERLNKTSKFKYLPYYIGNGGFEYFYECEDARTSSFFEKDRRSQGCQGLFLCEDLKFRPNDTKTEIDSHHAEGII